MIKNILKYECLGLNSLCNLILENKKGLSQNSFT